MNKMYNIAIIGAGQLGSRHLQGLSLANLDMAVNVVDSSANSLAIAKERYCQMVMNPRVRAINYYEDISLLPDKIDLAIIATGSIVRAEVTKRLLEEPRKIMNIVFEKFLFPSLADYSFVFELLESKKINAWVNCARRMNSFYKELECLLQGTTQAALSVSGGNWGLGCNGIHFIDLFAMLFGEHRFEINLSDLDKDIIESKRPGYIEFTGSIKGLISENYSFSLLSRRNSTEKIIIDISTDKYHINIDEQAGYCSIIDTKGKISDKRFKILYQSQLTGLLAEQILLKQYSDLPTFSESSNLHLQLLKPLIDFYNQITDENKDFCPVT